MAKAVIMPKFGFTQEDAMIVSWLKHEGDSVDAGDPIAEVTTDKVNMEVESPASGILAGLKYQEGETVPVTEVIAYVLAPGEKVPAGPVAETQPAPVIAPDGREGQIKATPIAEQFARQKNISLQSVSGTGPGGRVTLGDVEAYWNGTQEPGKVRATPAARRLAHELKIDLVSVPGTGPQGRIHGEDVRQRAANVTAAPATPAQAVISSVAAASSRSPVPLEGLEAESIALTPARRLIGERLQRSAQEAPHIYFEAGVDAGPLEELRKRGNSRLAEGQPRISLTALLARAVGWALQRHPMLNSRLQGDSILLLKQFNIGVAVAADTGLIVPVIRSVTQKSVTEIANELDDLVSRARKGRLRPDDVAEGTFTISNLGMYGVDRFTAIINPPQAAILAVGRTRKVFVPDENDQPRVMNQMSITLGADHRIVDGAMAARFMGDLREVLEHPEMMAL